MPSTGETTNALHRLKNMLWGGGLAAIALGLGLTRLASATALSSHPLIVAVRLGDCNAAVKLVNPIVNSNDDQTAFLAGRMLDEGICVKKDPVAATDFFARAADLGDKSAALDYATKVGLGTGTE
jgi:TPR repeat protein